MSCIKFCTLWLFLFAKGFAETTIVPYGEAEQRTTPVPQTSFTDLVFVLLKTLFILALFILFFYAAVLLFRKLTERRFDARVQGEDIKILERAIISNKSAIYLLQVKDKYVLIGESHNGLTQLGTFHEKL